MKNGDKNWMFKKECEYSDYICAKIQEHYTIPEMDVFLKKGNQKDSCKRLFLQETNVFSYYFIKNIFLRNLEEFAGKMGKYDIDMWEDFILKRFTFPKYAKKRGDEIGKKEKKNRSLKMCFWEEK